MIAMTASAAMLTIGGWADPSAPACDDGDVENLVANLVRDQLATAAPFHYALSAQARADLEDRVTAAAKNKEEAIFADTVKKGSASRAGDAAYRAAMDARQDRIKGNRRRRRKRNGRARERKEDGVARSDGLGYGKRAGGRENPGRV